MDNKIKTTLVAAAVSTALSTTAFAASTPHSHHSALPAFDINFELAKQSDNAKKSSLFSNQLAKQHRTPNGHIKTLESKADHFDERLGVTTFSWAKEQPKGVALNVLNRKAAISKSVERYVALNGGKHGVTPRAFSQAKLNNVHDLGRGAIISRYQQQHNGIEVYGRLFNVVMNQEMELVATAGHFSKVASKASSVTDDFQMSVTQAMSKAFSDMVGDDITFSKVSSKAGFDRFESPDSDRYHFVEQPIAKKVYYPVGKKLEAAYFIEFMASEYGSTDHMAYRYIMSAKDGKLLHRLSLTDYHSFTYKAYANSQAPYRPYDGPIGNSLSPHPTGVFNDAVTQMDAGMNSITIENAGISTNDPWLPEDATITSGNNVFAYADLYQPDGFNPATDANPDMTAETTSANTFDYTYDLFGDVFAEEMRKAAIVNLFFVNNYLHNVYYDHGFTEATGNAQNDNFGRGGVDGDAMNVEAQDHSGFNNANMSTGSDGTTPRMQMYLFTGTESQMTLTGLDEFTYEVATAFGTGGNLSDFSGVVAEMFDEADPTSDACEAATNDVAGKVALVNRGGCAFVTKALNAQNAGAIGVLVVNNDTTAPDNVIGMGGTDPDNQVQIPAIMLSYNSGNDLRQVMQQQEVTIELAARAVYRDGTVDNSIVIHEWGHYMTRRLGNGIYGSNQGRGMGEGWSDFLALLDMIDESDKMIPGNDRFQAAYATGGYATNVGDPTGEAGNYYFGIRRVPYSISFHMNALTFRHVENGVPLPNHHPVAFGADGASNSAVHRTGEVWSSTLLEAYLNLVNEGGHSFEEARNRMRDYIVAGLQITPFTPTLTEARDGILAAAAARDHNDYLLLREGFTRRGMGINAVAPQRHDAENGNVVEDFTSLRNAVEFNVIELDNQYNSMTGAYCDMDGILDAGETSSLMVTLKNIGNHMIEGAKVQITSDSDVTFSNDGMIELDSMAQWSDTAMGMVEMTLNSADVGEYINVRLEIMSDDETLQTQTQTIQVEVNRDMGADPSRTYENFGHAESVWRDWSKEKVGDELSGYENFLHHWTVFRPQEINFGIGNFIWGPDSIVETDVTLISPTLKVNETGDFVTQFTHYYEFEQSDGFNWDAGVVEISINEGEWQDVTAAGATLNPGYTGTVYPFTPNIGGREAYVGLSGGILLETITFPEGTVNGQDIRLRFRIGTDSASGAFGWILDDVAFSNISNLEGLFSGPIADDGVCMNRAPVVHAQDMTVSEITDGAQTMIALSVDTLDHDGNELTYEWTQTSGDMVTLSDTTAASPTFMAPYIGEDKSYGFSVTVSDGTASTMAHMMVNVTDVNTAPMLSGGGAMTVNDDASIELMVTAMDSDGDDLTYTWMMGDEAIDNNSDSYTFQAMDVTENTDYTFTVMASDGELTSNTETFTVTVVDANVAPVLTGGGSVTVVDNNSIDLMVEGTDANGDALTYTWMMGDQAIDNDGNSYTYMAPNVAEDTTVTFTVYASDGVKMSNTETIEVLITNGNTAPSISGGTSVTVRESENIELTVTGSDADGDDLTYDWKVNGASSNNTTNTYNYEAPAVTSDTSVTITVTATDGEAMSNTETFTVTVENKKSSGGSALWTLLLAPLAFLRRRKIKK